MPSLKPGLHMTIAYNLYLLSPSYKPEQLGKLFYEGLLVELANPFILLYQLNKMKSVCSTVAANRKSDNNIISY